MYHVNNWKVFSLAHSFHKSSSFNQSNVWVLKERLQFHKKTNLNIPEKSRHLGLKNYGYDGILDILKINIQIVSLNKLPTIIFKICYEFQLFYTVLTFKTVFQSFSTLLFSWHIWIVSNHLKPTYIFTIKIQLTAFYNLCVNIEKNCNSTHTPMDSFQFEIIN